MKKVLEVNVDDLNSGGVFSLVKSVIINNDSDIKFDIGAIERFENSNNISLLKDNGCDVHYVGYEGSKWKKQIKVYKNLKRFLKENRYQYVHIHADTANKLMVSGLAAKHAKISNIILHSHSSGVEGGNKVKIFIHKICSRLLKNVGTVFVACSTEAAKWMFPNISIDKIIFIKNGVPLKKFQFDQAIRDKRREEIGANKEIVIGHVGRLMAPKNHEYLIEILKNMVSRGIAVKLLIVGEGYKEESLKKLVHNYNLDKYVVFYGASENVNELLMAMDIFCLPSFFEGMPIVGVEAQASGLPVIYSSNVTQEARILSNVRYLPIEKTNIPEWIEAIIEMTNNNHRDETSNIQVRNAGFDISDTLKSFLNIYRD